MHFWYFCCDRVGVGQIRTLAPFISHFSLVRIQDGISNSPLLYNMSGRGAGYSPANTNLLLSVPFTNSPLPDMTCTHSLVMESTFNQLYLREN